MQTYTSSSKYMLERTASWNLIEVYLENMLELSVEDLDDVCSFLRDRMIPSNRRRSSCSAFTYTLARSNLL
jgi:intein-encoded DNA endonuclease-like protein